MRNRSLLEGYEARLLRLPLESSKSKTYHNDICTTLLRRPQGTTLG